jgi:tripartite-type tricarboxylate transporter receptor subunit TctC
MDVRFLLGALFATVALTNAARSQDFPTRPITFVVSFAPGGLTDIPARILAAEMQPRIGQPIVVENKAGASGITGGSYVVRAAPDGYTLLVSALSEVQNFYYLPVPYNALTDLAPVGKIADGPPVVLIVNDKSPFKNVADLIAYAKANPTKANFATSGPATSPAIAVTQLNSLAGTKIVGVAYNGTGPATAAVVSGEVQGAFVFYAAAKGLIDSGQLRVLAIASSHRLANVPDVPTMTELGFKDFEHSGFVGLSAPRNTPPSVIAVLNKFLNESINAPAFRARIEPLGMTIPPQPNTPEAYGEFMAKQAAYQGELAKLTGHAQQNH